LLGRHSRHTLGPVLRLSPRCNCRYPFRKGRSGFEMLKDREEGQVKTEAETGSSKLRFTELPAATRT
jgi:hypothetical protein